MKSISQANIDRYFRIAVFIKGFDGILEVIGGFILLFIPATTIHGIVAFLTTHEVSEDKHAFIANYIRRLDQQVTPGTELIVTLYLLIHGIIKIVLAYALLSRKYHYFPLAIVFLLLFLFYEVYLVGLNHSVTLGLLCLLDSAVIWLTYMEYERHRSKGLPTSR